MGERIKGLRFRGAFDFYDKVSENSSAGYHVHL